MERGGGRRQKRSWKIKEERWGRRTEGVSGRKERREGDKESWIKGERKGGRGQTERVGWSGEQKGSWKGLGGSRGIEWSENLNYMEEQGL